MATGDLDGRVMIVTGSNTGIGRVTAVELAKRGAHIVMGCRSMDRAKEAFDELVSIAGEDKVDQLRLDLGEFASVRQFADDFRALELPLHVLVNNAGLAGAKGKTPEGFEVHFGVNHLGPHLLTSLLIDMILEGAPGRVVNVSSNAHTRVKQPIDYAAVREDTKTPTGFPEYSVSKLANIYFTRSLSTRLEGTGVTTYSLHPGVVASDIWRRLPGPLEWLAKKFMTSNADGAKTSIHLAASPDVANESGTYYSEMVKREPTKLARDMDAAEELWRRSNEWTGAEWPF